MSDVIIRVEGLGKKYHIGAVQQRQDTLVGAMVDTARRTARKVADPRSARSSSGQVEEIWALKDVSFELRQGEVLGIIGRNGSGKSTLLKILSRVTAPTEGRVELYGKIGSLLEVGIGFHPELTGRENVFLSGSLLGMKQQQIDRLFDEIVDFSEIEKFIDTPVKHYSSGMYIRLAFSVAAHFSPEILILDEVLSVGDAPFQKKSLEKMERLAKSGRTVLFVSHALPSVGRLCNRGLFLENGRITFSGTGVDAVGKYLRAIRLLEEPNHDPLHRLSPSRDLRDSHYRWDGYVSKILTHTSVHKLDGTPSVDFSTGDSIRIRVNYVLTQPILGYCRINLLNYSGMYVMMVHNSHNGPSLHLQGKGYLECEIHDLRLVAGTYSIMIEIGEESGTTPRWLDCVSNALQIRVSAGDYVGGVGTTQGEVTFSQRSQWTVHEEESINP